MGLPGEAEGDDNFGHAFCLDELNPSLPNRRFPSLDRPANAKRRKMTESKPDSPMFLACLQADSLPHYW
jgi:hypothetical protein